MKLKSKEGIFLMFFVALGLFFVQAFAIDKSDNLEKTPGIITSIVMAKSIDKKTGEPIDITPEFSSTDKDIVLVIKLQDYKKGTRFEYVRYFNSKFLDHGSIKVKNPKQKTIAFIWSLKKKDSYHLKGEYRIKIYTNGMFEKEISYSVN